MSRASSGWAKAYSQPRTEALATARLRTTQRVEDVHAFPGHIACDAASRSELVVPIVAEGRLIGVLDLDSPSPARFTADDQAGAEALIARIAAALAG